jgi:hypothetical protein
MRVAVGHVLCCVRHQFFRRLYWDQRPQVLPDGTLLDLFWTFDRQTGEYLNIHASKSTDGGRSFSPGTELLLHDRSLASQTVSKRKGDSVDAFAEMGAFSLGLPDAVALGPDELLAVYYTGPDKDQTDLEWVRVRV